MNFGFSQFFFLGGDLLSGMIFGPRQGQSHMGGELALGMELDEGGFKNWSAEARNAPPPAKLEQILVF